MEDQVITKSREEFNDDKKMHHLPFVIWLKNKKKIKDFIIDESTGEILIYDKKI